MPTPANRCLKRGLTLSGQITRRGKTGCSAKGPPPSQTEPKSTSRRHGRYWLVAVVSTVALVWLVVLPMIAQRPAVGERIERLKRQGIDPSAMYYTDLEMMQPIFYRQQQRHWISDQSN